MSQLANALAQASMVIGAKKCEKLEQFSDILLEWNKTHNLTGAKSHEQVVENIIDALYPATFIVEPKTILDVGTGAGFPGLVLAIFYDQGSVTLCEPIKKRSAFLRYASAKLQLAHVNVESKRVQELPPNRYDLITSRAVGNLQMLLEITKHLRGKESSYLLYKGSYVTEELEPIKEKINYTIYQRGHRRYLYVKEIG